MEASVPVESGVFSDSDMYGRHNLPVLVPCARNALQMQLIYFSISDAWHCTFSVARLVLPSVRGQLH